MAEPQVMYQDRHGTLWAKPYEDSKPTEPVVVMDERLYRDIVDSQRVLLYVRLGALVERGWMPYKLRSQWFMDHDSGTVCADTLPEAVAAAEEAER